MALVIKAILPIFCYCENFQIVMMEVEIDNLGETWDKNVKPHQLWW